MLYHNIYSILLKIFVNPKIFVCDNFLYIIYVLYLKIYLVQFKISIGYSTEKYLFGNLNHGIEHLAY
jgi:hypothetical protein